MQGPLLELRHLQMIRAIAATGRVTDAADRLGVTPSALSHRIREAERRLEVVLFTRIHKKLRMTPAAEYLAQVAERILGELERTEADVRRMNRGVIHVVRLAIEDYSAYHWLPAFLGYFRARTEGIEVQVMAAAGRDPLRALADRHLDVAIVSGDAERRGTVPLLLFDDELLFIMPPGHRLAGRTHIDGQDIVGESFITTSKVPEPDREFARLFRASECYPRWTATVELPEAIIELVAAGLGTSVLAGWAVRVPLRAGRIAAARVGRDGISVCWHAAIRAEDDGDTPIAEMARLLEQWCATSGGFG